MDHFELYGLPVTFNPDMAVVKQKFYELSKKFHPDFYIMEDQAKQDEVLEMSTLNNKAYQTLTDPQKRLHYILEIKGLLTEGENYLLPQVFLMEMMEVNEALMELEFDPDAGKLLGVRSKVDGIEQQLFDEILQLTTDFEVQDKEKQQQSLLKIKDLYYRNKYLLRLRERLDR